MKKFIFLGLLLAFISCTQTNQPEDFSQNISEEYFETRSNESEELQNSSLLNELRAFNDSLAKSISYASTNQLNISPTLQNKINYVSIVDAIGYIVGYEHAKAYGLNHQISQIAATIQSVISSLRAAAEVSFPQKVPQLSSNPFQDYENVYSAITKSPNYSTLYAQQVQLLGDMSLLNNYINFFSQGINHNLMIQKYRAGLSEDEIITNVFSPEINDIIYSEDFQTQISDETNCILEGNFDFICLFADRKRETVSLSQKKAGEIMRLFSEAILNNNNSFDQIKFITYHYMANISSSSEIEHIEKSILLHAIPINITSRTLWTSHNTNLNI